MWLVGANWLKNMCNMEPLKMRGGLSAMLNPLRPPLHCTCAGCGVHEMPHGTSPAPHLAWSMKLEPKESKSELSIKYLSNLE